MVINFAKLHRNVVFGQSKGKIIWQPRIGCWLSDKQFAGEPLPPPFTGMELPQIYRELNCSARVYDYNACFKRIEPPSVTRTERRLNDTDTEITIHTPVGKQVAINRRTPSSPREIRVKWEVTTEDDLHVAAWRAEHTTWTWDPSAYEAVQRQWGTLGAPTIYLPRVNIQDLYLNTMGVQNAVYAMVDWPKPVQAYFRALDECHDRLMDVVNASPIDIINFGDNVHCGTLPPEWFKRYVLPVYQHRCERLHRAGKFIHAHWDGDTKGLLPLAQETGLDGIEAITPQPQGDVTLDEMKAALGDRMFLIDGIPAIYFDRTYSPATLVECVDRLIDLFAPKLVLGISDEISSHGDIERIRIVGHIVDQYNAQFPD